MAALTNCIKVKGVTIFLKNGKKLAMPNEEVVTDPRGDDFERFAQIKLTNSDLITLKKNPIISFKLYDVVAHVDKSEQYCELLNCLASKK